MQAALKVVASFFIGYFLGTINPAAIISKIKNADLRRKGTKNLGAMNVMLNLGKRYAALVMLFDICKAFAAVRLVTVVFGGNKILGMFAGLSAILGHCYPIYMHFKGGKGLAAFAGVVLAYSPILFLILLALTVILVLLANYTFMMPYSAGILFPTAVFFHYKSTNPIGDAWILTVICVLCSAIIMHKHFENIIKAINGSDVKVRSYIRHKLFKSNKSEEAEH